MSSQADAADAYERGREDGREWMREKAEADRAAAVELVDAMRQALHHIPGCPRINGTGACTCGISALYVRADAFLGERNGEAQR